MVINPECLVRDVSDAAGNRIAACLAERELKECGLVFVEQNTIHTAEGRIGSIYVDGQQVGAVKESIVPDTDDTGRNHNVGQTEAGIECGGPNVGNAAGKRDV